MADTFTTNYNFTLPEVGGSDDTWGTKLNANWESADLSIKANADAAAAAQSSANAIEARSINTGGGLTGGGTLEASRTLSINVGVTAGAGLTGGGTLTASRTITLGTPGTLSGGTSNNATSTSHTHAISSTTSRSNTSSSTLLAAAGMNNHRTSGDHDGRYYTKSEVDDMASSTAEAVGSYILAAISSASGDGSYPPGSTISGAYLSPCDTEGNIDQGDTLPGTWRAMGLCLGHAAPGTLWKRIS